MTLLPVAFDAVTLPPKELKIITMGGCHIEVIMFVFLSSLLFPCHNTRDMSGWRHGMTFMKECRKINKLGRCRKTKRERKERIRSVNIRT